MHDTQPTVDTAPEWDLSDLFPDIDSSELTEALAAIETKAKAFKTRYADQIADLDAPDLLECLRDYEAIRGLLDRVTSFVALRYHADTLDPERGKSMGDVRDAITAWLGPLTFFETEICALKKKKLKQLLTTHPDLARYKPYFRKLRATRQHKLSAELEQFALEISSASAASINRLFDETCASLQFRAAGKTRNLTETLDLLQHSDRKLRRSASRAISKELGTRLPLFTLVMNTVIKETVISDRWRGFATPQAARHLSNDIEADVVEAMLTSVTGTYADTSHRYYRLKARWLGLRKLKEWDRNAPLPMVSDTQITWPEARDQVLTAFGHFSPEMAKITTEFFERGWIDAAIRPGKASGAFCMSTGSAVHPYVLLNFQKRPRDVMTLAHELGHAVHQTLAARQGDLMADTSLTLAETASVFGETLTFNQLLQSVSGEGERMALLAERVEDIINTMVRQTAFHVFECRIHETQRTQGELTSDAICRIWMEVQTESLGPAFSFSNDYRNHWAYVPHFIHSPFYVYAYAFGMGLVLALYAAYESGIDDFVPKYLDALAAGGTKHHSELLKPFGLSVADPDFWKKGVSILSGYIDDLEAMQS